MPVTLAKTDDIPARVGRPSPDRSVFVAIGVSLALLVLAGAALVVYPWVGFRRFNVEHMVPWMVGLAVVRGVGPSASALAVSLHVTAVLHQRARPRARGGPRRLAIVAGVLVPVAYLGACGVLLGTASIITRTWLGLGPREFFHLLEPGDFAYGFASAAVLGIVPALWSVIAHRVLSPHRGLAFKLFITWLGFAGVSLVVRIGFSLFGGGE